MRSWTFGAGAKGRGVARWYQVGTGAWPGTGAPVLMDSGNVDASQAVTHWTVETVEITTDPILDIQVDGDIVAKTPQLIRVLPAGLRVVV